MKDEQNLGHSLRKSLIFLIGGMVLGAIIAIGALKSIEKSGAVDISGALGKKLFAVDNVTYTSSTLPGDGAMEYYHVENSVYGAQARLARELALRIALARDANKNVDAKSLPSLEELLPLPKVSDEEARQLYDQLTAKYGSSAFGGQPFQAIKGQLMLNIDRQRAQEFIGQKIQELENAGRIKILLNAPIPPKVDIDFSVYPARGASNSNIVFVQVSDYMCPHCRETQNIVTKLYDEFGDKMKFVQVNFPLSPAGLSGALTRGGFCAAQQGNEFFWKFHEKAFTLPWESNSPKSFDHKSSFNNEALSIGESIGVDKAKFEDCLNSSAAEAFIAQVQNQFSPASGFVGTPAFYLNGQIINVAPEQLESTIRNALASPKSR